MNLKGAIITWPFELPVPKQRTLGGYYPEESVLANRDACIAVALRWAAEQCNPRDVWPTIPDGVTVRRRILAALPKDEANAA